MLRVIMGSEYKKIASHEAKKEHTNKVVLLYSGGLDTSCMLTWIKEKYDTDVITLTMDLGQQDDDLQKIREKALKFGASKAIVIDAKDEFANEYLAPLIKANGSYQGDYHISTVSRPLMAKWAVKIAEKEGADAVAHGCTGKGNDQVRIEGAALSLNPEIKIIAPVREWAFGREEEIEYAKKHGIPIPVAEGFPYSIDDNMWGMTWEGGEIEDPAKIPQLENFLKATKLPENSPELPGYVRIEFVEGIPVALDDKKMKLSELIQTLNKIAGSHGVGVVHHIEDRVVGLKVRGIYEMPAARVIIEAHKNLEKYVCTATENELKQIMDIKWSYLCYGGLWNDPTIDAINAFNDEINGKVTGKIIVKMYKGKIDVVSLESPFALFDTKLATFMKDDTFNQNSSASFIELYTLQMKLANQIKKGVKR